MVWWPKNRPEIERLEFLCLGLGLCLGIGSLHTGTGVGECLVTIRRQERVDNDNKSDDSIKEKTTLGRFLLTLICLGRCEQSKKILQVSTDRPQHWYENQHSTRKYVRGNIAPNLHLLLTYGCRLIAHIRIARGRLGVYQPRTLEYDRPTSSKPVCDCSCMYIYICICVECFFDRERNQNLYKPLRKGIQWVSSTIDVHLQTSPSIAHKLTEFYTSKGHLIIPPRVSLLEKVIFEDQRFMFL